MTMAGLMHNGHGKLVLVVGPSGAGKDTLMEFARRKLACNRRVHFIRRVINRPPAPGEDHEAVGTADFLRRADDGEFALYWNAHGHHYGLPWQVDEWLSDGDIVVANGSRAMLDHARGRYPQLLVVNVTVSDSVLAQRLHARGREDAAEIARRLQRNQTISFNLPDAVEIDNSGTPEQGADLLVMAITNPEG